MDNLVKLGQSIKEKRLSLNMRMEEVARQAEITRSTLWSIEKGTSNCSIKTIFRVLDILGLSFNVSKNESDGIFRSRATRQNTVLDKKINRFILMCVEQYALSLNIGSKEAYRQMSESGVIEELKNNYEDLHGMSTLYLNDYIESIIVGDI